MPASDPDTAHKLLDIAVEQWQYTLLLIGSLCGSIYWAAHQVFSTREQTLACKIEILDALDKHKTYDDKRIEKLMEKNDQKHDAIEAKVDKLINHIINGSV